jgi:hypothetical protein
VKPPDQLPDEPEQPSPRRPMLPRDRRLRIGHPPQAIPVHREDGEEIWGDDSEEVAPSPRSHRQDFDPVLGYIMAMALSIGLTPVQTNMRYVLLWTLLAAMGGIAFLIGTGIRLKVTDPGDLLWGIALGIFTGGALMLVGWDTLATVSHRLFSAGQDDNKLFETWVFQATVFAMPVAESLFFRGAMQRTYSIPVVAVLASLWSVLMFFPHLNLSETPVVGVVFGTALVLLNFLYGYVNWRHGLAASFFCQISAGSMLLLVPTVVKF